MLKFIKSAITGTLQSMLNSRLFFPLFNLIFEKGSWGVKDFLYRNIHPPHHDKIWVIRLLNGKKVRYHLNHREEISWHFATNYLWHDRELSHLEHALNEYYPHEQCCFDIGANQGIRSITFLSTGRQTYLFEPNKKLWPILEQLIEMNGFRTAHLMKICLSDRAGSQPFYVSSSGYLSSLSKQHAQLDTIVEQYDVEVQTVDYLVRTNNLHPAVLKLDVETSELQVLQGARETLTKLKPAVCAEILLEPINRKAIFEYMESLGYTSYTIMHGDRLFLEPARYNDEHRFNNYLFIQDENLRNFLIKRNLMLS